MKILILFFTIVTSSLFAQQNITVSYEHAIMDKKITRSDKPELLKGVSYTLLCTPTQYWFDLDDTIDTELVNRNEKYTRSGGSNSVYKFLTTKEKFKECEFKGVNMLIQMDFDTKWDITKETKEISGYQCIKATTITYDDILGEPRLDIVWFTPEIALPFGPKGYDGLPGLILELNVGKHILVAKKIDFETRYEIIKPTGKSVTKEEAFEFMGIDVALIRKNVLKQRAKENSL